MNVSLPIAAVLLDLGFPANAAKAIPLLARTAGLLAHLAEEQEQPVGFLMAAQGRGSDHVRARHGGGRPDARARGRGTAVGRAARRSTTRATARSSPTSSSARRSTATSSRRPGSRRRRAGGLADITRLPLTEKHELRASRTRRQPVRHASLRDTRGDRPHLLDERHDRHAELHPAHRRRPRELGHGLGAELRGVGRRSRPAHRLDLQRRAVRGGRGARRVRPDRPLPRPGRHGQHRAADARDRAAAARRGGADAVLCRLSRSSGRRAGLDLARSSVERVLVAGEPGGGEPAFRAEARGGLGREGHRGDGHRRHRRRRSGASARSRTACTSARAASSTRS